MPVFQTHKTHTQTNTKQTNKNIHTLRHKMTNFRWEKNEVTRNKKLTEEECVVFGVISNPGLLLDNLAAFSSLLWVIPDLGLEG